MNRGRLTLIAAAVVVAVVAFLVAKPSDDNNDKTGTTKTSTNTGTTGTTAPSAPQVTRIVVRNGKPVGGVKRIDAKQGERLRFTVTSDVADEIHVHGYDFMKDVPAGGTVRFDFPAKISGSFEVELEQRKEQIADLRVQP